MSTASRDDELLIEARLPAALVSYRIEDGIVVDPRLR
jgi:hypothetical protein